MSRLNLIWPPSETLMGQGFGRCRQKSLALTTA